MQIQRRDGEGADPEGCEEAFRGKEEVIKGRRMREMSAIEANQMFSISERHCHDISLSFARDISIASSYSMGFYY